MLLFLHESICWSHVHSQGPKLAGGGVRCEKFRGAEEFICRYREVEKYRLRIGIARRFHILAIERRFCRKYVCQMPFVMGSWMTGRKNFRRFCRQSLFLSLSESYQRVLQRSSSYFRRYMCLSFCTYGECVHFGNMGDFNILPEPSFSVMLCTVLIKSMKLLQLRSLINYSARLQTSPFVNVDK